MKAIQRLLSSCMILDLMIKGKNIMLMQDTTKKKQEEKTMEEEKKNDERAEHKEKVKNTLDSIHRVYGSKHSCYGVFLDYDGLHNILYGLKVSSFTVLAGQTGVGKTSLALNIALKWTMLRDWKRTVIIYTMEMTKEQAFVKLLSMAIGIDLRNLDTENCPDDVAEKLYETGEKIKSAIYIIGRRGISAYDVLQHQAGLIVIDDIQSMVFGQYPQDPIDAKDLNEVSNQLASRNIPCYGNRTPILAISRLSSSIDRRNDKKPRLSDLETKALKDDADAVLLMREDEKDRRYVDIEVAKSRYGKTDGVKLYFDKPTGRFLDEKPNDSKK